MHDDAEVMVCGKWIKVFGTISGMQEGWLFWWRERDYYSQATSESDVSLSGYAAPGTWRFI